MMDVKGILKGLGLTKKEGEVLLALYALKKATVAGLAKQSGLPRTTIYTALAKLLEKQIALRARVGKRELWEAVTPKRLLAMQQEHVTNLEALLPALEQLTTIAKSTEKSTVAQYKDAAGLQRVYDMILELSRGERVLGFEGAQSSERKMTVLPHAYSQTWHDTIKRKGIILEVAVSEKLLDIIKNASPEMLKAAHGRASITYVLPDTVMDFHSDVLVFGHHVVIVTPKQQTAVVITDYLTSIAFRHMLGALHQMGKKVDLNAYIQQYLTK